MINSNVIQFSDNYQTIKVKLTTSAELTSLSEIISKMTKKAIKDLEKEITYLQNGFHDLKIDFDTLSVKYETLEAKYNQSMPKLIFKCNLCDKDFETNKDIKEHRRSQHASDGKFTCDECNKLFDEEWKLNAHIRKFTHGTSVRNLSNIVKH